MPIYKPGDHVLTFNWGKISKGDVVVFSTFLSFWGSGGSRRLQNRTKTDSGQALRLRSGRARMTDEDGLLRENIFYIKRVDKISGDLFYTSADNKNQSTRVYKVKKEQIVGKVFLKY